MNIVSKAVTAIKNPRFIVLYFLHKFTHFIKDDRKYAEWCYRFERNGKIDILNPKTFNEKIQWMKLYYHNPILTKFVDKYEAKFLVADKIGQEHIIPTLGVWDSFDDIDFSTLPEKFVLKTTHGGGSLGVVVCTDKSSFDMQAAKSKLNASLKSDYYQYREWAYKNVKRRIIAEKFMSDDSENNKNGISDYKFYCFNGVPKFLYMSQGLEVHETARISFLTMDWQFAPFRRIDFAPFEQLPAKPRTFDQMIEVCKKLSSGLPFVRVDLYEIDQQVYFSEMTFYPCNGSMPFYPQEWDLKTGEMFELPNKIL